MQHLLEARTVFRAIYHVRCGANDRHTIFFQAMRQFERGLAAVLHDHTDGLFHRYYFQHVF